MSADRLLRFSDIPAWKHLTDSPLSTDKRISLIADIFSDPDEVKSLKTLSGGDAQSVIDVIDEVLIHFHVRRTGPLT